MLRRIAEPVSSSYKRHIQNVDWSWLMSFFTREQDAEEMLQASIRQMQLRLSLGQVFLEFLPNYSLLYEVRTQPKLRKVINGPTDLYPECCRNIAYLPFGMAGAAYWPPAGGIYMVDLVNAATRWLEEFSAPWKSKKRGTG